MNSDYKAAIGLTTGREHAESATTFSYWPPMDIERILRQTRSVAIVGVSGDPLRPSHGVWQYLKSASDYALYLVNPTLREIDGDVVYPSLADLPVVPDMVDVFRRREHLVSVLRDTLDIGAKTLWLQQGLTDDEVAREGAAAGLQVVMDRCLKVDHRRFVCDSVR